METHSNKRVKGPIHYPITDEEFEATINPFAPGDFAEKRVLKLVE